MDRASPEASISTIADWQRWAEITTLPSEDLDGWVDTEYRFANVNPAYSSGKGPTVCIDEAHFNYHTANGIYKPFVSLLEGDGFRVTEFRNQFARNALVDCEILVIANAQAPGNTIGFGSSESNWAYPHGSALTRTEIDELILWIRSGGALLLIADHAPLPAAVADLALLVGVHMLDGYAFASRANLSTVGTIVFGTVNDDVWRTAMQELSDLAGVDFGARYAGVFANPGSLQSHPAVAGRTAEERIEWLVTFHGQAFLASDEWDPLMVMGPNAVSLIPLYLNFKDAKWEDGPVLSADNWLHGATRKLDRGRIGVLGEGGMCTAQFDDLDGEITSPLVPYGINAPQAPYNAQFCLNVVRWLSGIIGQSIY